MGDNTSLKEIEKPNEHDSDSGSSLKQLRSVKPSENIAISDEPTRVSEEMVQKIHEDVPERTLSSEDSAAKVETFFEKPLEPSLSENKKLAMKVETGSEISQPESELKSQSSVDDTKISSEVSADKTILLANADKAKVASAASGLIHSDRIIRNQSDIFSLKEQTTMASAIFSVNGSPSRKVFRRKEVVASNVFPFGQTEKEEPPPEKMPVVDTAPKESAKDLKECYNELTRPSDSARNPLTGTGLSSNDEYKSKGSKRKDGNPVLGLGYSPEAAPSAHRIPPGGYSHKLW